MAGPWIERNLHVSIAETSIIPPLSRHSTRSRWRCDERRCNVQDHRSTFGALQASSQRNCGQQCHQFGVARTPFIMYPFKSIVQWCSVAILIHFDYVSWIVGKMASELAETWSTTESTTNLQGWRFDLRLRGTLDSPSHPPRRHPRGRGASRPWPAVRSLHCAVYTTRVPGIQTWHFEGDGFDRRQCKKHGEIRSDICNWHISIIQHFKYFNIFIICISAFG